MQALLLDGPFENQHYDVPDPPPEHITPEAMPSADAMLMEVEPGEPYREARFERHGYRLRGIDRTLTPAPNADNRLPIYAHAPESDRKE
jgi:hypothetical protein